MDQDDGPEPGGTDYLDSAQTTPVPILGTEIHRQLRAGFPTTQAGDDSQAEGVELNDPSTVSSESPESKISSRDGSDAPASDDGAPTLPTAARTVAR